jgi:hypothetical protein
MHGITVRLPERADMRDHVAFIVHVLGNVFPDERQLARWSGRTLPARLLRKLPDIVELAL